MLEPVLDPALWAAIGRPPHAKPLERLTLRWLDDQAIGALSAGDITGSENDESTFVPVPGGLFDERVFGVIPRLSDGHPASRRIHPRTLTVDSRSIASQHRAIWDAISISPLARRAWRCYTG